MSAEGNRQEQRPAHSPQARWWAVLLGLALLVVAVIAIRELWVFYGADNPAASWVLMAVSFMREATPLRAGIIGAVVAGVGLILVVAALSPRAKPYRRIASTTAPIWVRRVDVARLATATAKRIPGVLTASSLAKNQKVTVSVEVARADDDIRRILNDAITGTLAPAFGDSLEVDVQVTETTDPDARVAALPTTAALHKEEES